MKTQLTLLICILTTFALSAQKRTVDVGSFSEFSLGIAGNVYLKQGDDEKVEVDCSDETFEKLEFNVGADRLTIRRKDRNGWSSWRTSNVDIYITMKDIERLSVSGSGEINSENTINTDELRLDVSGSGDMDLDVESSEVEIRISGSGSISLNGSSDKAEARISGSGKVKAEDMEVKTFKASISGSGSCYVTASEEVSASISGSGNVYYAGNPDRVIGNSSGSGKVRKM